MHFSTLSAIRKGLWLVDQQWADLHLPLVLRMLEGESVDLGVPKTESPDNVNPIQLAARGYKVGRYTSLDRLPEGSVAIIDLVGPVVRYGDCSDGLEDTANLMRRAYNAGNISGIILNIDSPGGEASGTAMFADLIKAAPKPVLGLVNDGMAASAAMWIASQCTEIYATNKLSSFGSIGAYTMLPDILKAYEAKGIKIHEIYAPQSVDKNKDYRDAMTGDYSGIEQHLYELVEFFKAAVKEGRGNRLNLKAGDPFTGKMYRAAEAKKIGLIDGFASLEQAIGRVDQLSKRKPNNSTQTQMSTVNKYPALTTAAGRTDAFEASEEGAINLSQEEASALETRLAQAGTDATAVATHANAIQEKDTQIQTLTTQLAAAKQDADQQRALAVKYGAEDANKGTGTTAAAGAETTEDKPTKKVHPITAQAQAAFSRNAK